MQRVSSNFTIFFKIFLPTVWITFFGMFSVAIVFAENANLPFGGGNIIRYGILATFLVFLLLMYFSIMQIKRVDFGQDGIYISNYFKTYRYQYKDIKSISEKDYLVMKIGVIELLEKGKLGRKLSFIISQVNFNEYISNNAKLFEHLT